MKQINYKNLKLKKSPSFKMIAKTASLLESRLHNRHESIKLERSSQKGN